MVHALLHTHKVLRPNGWLINVHDLPAPHGIEFRGGNVIQKVGWLMDKDDFENERKAFYALAQVVEDHFFELEEEQEFDYNIYIDGLEEFREWLADWWTSAILPEGVKQRLEVLIQNADQPIKIVLKSPARMTKLSAIRLNEAK